MTAPGQEEIFQMDSMGIRRHLEEEREEAVSSTGSCKLLKACSYKAKKTFSAVALTGAHKTRACASRINARAVWFSSDCYSSCHQFCMRFDTTDHGKLQELTKIQKMAWIILEMKKRRYNLCYQVRPKAWSKVRGAAAQVYDTVSWFCLGHGPGE